MFLIRKLKRFDVSRHTVETAYRGLVESILQFNTAAWLWQSEDAAKNKLSSIAKKARKAVGKNLAMCWTPQ